MTREQRADLPLREVLHEEIEKLVAAMGNEDTAEADSALERIAVLIDQIPLVFEARIKEQD
jgi:Icc-related predicted phosphoesterase